MSRAHVVDRLDLDSYVTTIDTAFAGSGQNMLLRLTGEQPDLAVLPLDHQHPLEELLGFVAPPSWQALGMRCAGRARRLGEIVDVHSGDYERAEFPSRGSPVAVHVTLLVDRSGGGAAVMRDSELVAPLTGTPEGLLGDTCRRALGLPTTAPPPSTAELWLRVWLDRLVEALSGDDDATRSFAELAALHPALLGGAAMDVPDIPATPTRPEELADVTLLLASWWTWSRLRRIPDVVDTGGPPLAAALAAWMDEGMVARWLLTDLPPLDLLLRQAGQVLSPPAVQDVEQTLAICGVPLPGDRR